MRIYLTQIGHPNFRGGGNIVAHNLAEKLSEFGHKVTAFFIAPKELLSVKPAAKYDFVLRKSSKFPILNCLRTFLAVRKFFKKEGEPDVVISLGYEGLFLSYFKRKFLFIAASHNPFLRRIGFKELFLDLKWLNPLNFGKWLFLSSFYFDRLMKLRADFTQCLSKFGAEQCMDIYGVPAGKIFILPNGINVDLYPVRREPLSKTILFMGGTVEYKGLDICIKALPLVVKKYPDIKLLVVGNFDNRLKALIKLAKSLDVFNKIEWRGLVQPELIAEFYQLASVVAMPSRLDLFPLVALESFAFGVPLVAANVGSIPEIVSDGVNGLIVERENPEKLAEAIIYVFDNLDKAGKMARAGRKIVEEKFSWDKIIKKLEVEILARVK